MLGVYRHRLLGFDARERFVPLPRLYPAARRREQLLRPDVEKPLSVDVCVWPTVFQNETVERRLSLFDFGLGLVGALRPMWTGPFQDLWVSLPDLDAQLALVGRDLRGPADVVAISVDEHWRYPLWDRPLSEEEPAEPAGLDDEWRLLGFDVADGFLTSALMNGSFDERSRTRLRSMFAELLNDVHLFDRLEAAKLCAEHCDEHAVGRAPHFPYALWARAPRAARGSSS